ncbi:MAG: DUF748 domain-containing protein [Candidatus Omnitrophota bacterium]
MLKKIGLVSLKVVAGIVVFYLFIAAVVLPMVIKWAAEDQGTKVLKHPVKLASASFNPFLWRLTLGGFKVLDKDGQLMAGFDRLSVDASFLALFKKIYRIESVALEGLKVNVVLLDGGKVNLMELAPAPVMPAPAAVPAAATPTVAKGSASKETAPPAQPLPLVIIDSLTLANSRVDLLDRTIHPNFSVALTDIAIKVTGFSTKPDGAANIIFQAKLGGKGTIGSEINIKPFATPIDLETSFSLDGLALDILSPYVGKYAGRDLKDGVLEFKTDYRISGNKLTAAHKILIQRFAFGQSVASKDALHLPFGLVVALLEDPQGRIKISLPVTGDMSKPEFHYWSLVGQVVTNFFTGLVTKPFAFLAGDTGTDELGYVRFQPGKTDITDAEKKKIQSLLQSLKDHPKLKLEVDGGYDPDLDWKAINQVTLEKDFAELRKNSTRSDSWIYQMLYQRRVGIRELWDITKKYKLKEGSYDDDKVVAEIKRQLIEGAAVDKPALEALAAARAKAVSDLIAGTGFDPARLSTGPVRQEQASMGLVPLEFTLTVFEEPKPEK